MRRLQKTYIVYAVFIIIVAAGAFFIGRASVKKNGSDADGMLACGVRFHAVIEERDGRAFRVQGLDVNNISHRRCFDFSLEEDATVWKNNLEIPVEELKAGDKITVTYYGYLYETDPAYITQVKKIELWH